MATIETPPGAAAHLGPDDELRDGTFAQLVGIGFLLGIPATFIVLFTGLVLTTGITGAAPAIAWAAVVGGGYFGGFVVLSAHMVRTEREERMAAAAARVPAPAQPHPPRIAA